MQRVTFSTTQLPNDINEQGAAMHLRSFIANSIPVEFTGVFVGAVSLRYRRSATKSLVRV